LESDETFQSKNTVQQLVEPKSIDHYPSSYQPTEEERALFRQMWDNRMRIQDQHQQLMLKATRLLYHSSTTGSSFSTRSNTNNNFWNQPINTTH